MVQRLSVEEFLAKSKGETIIDVRSPKEFLHAHIPGAISLPLFSDEERAEVGTAYKRQGREAAMNIGLKYYGSNMQRIISGIKDAGNPKELYVHCWRGGMRSGVVSWMLDLFGYKVFTLEKGYKVFRHFILEQFEKKYPFQIIGGRTGSAKTKVLHELAKHNQRIIDLEGIANHKGSAFGALGEAAPPSQEMFENILGLELYNSDSTKPIWLEDESQRIGWVNLPNNIWGQMREAKVFYLDIPFEERLIYITENYGVYDLEGLKDATKRISKRLGGLDTKLALQFLDEKNFTEAFRILLRYYDKFYDRATDNREPNSIHKILCEEISPDKNTEKILAEIKIN